VGEVVGEREAGGFGDEGFDVAGVEVGQPGGQPVGVLVAEGGREGTVNLRSCGRLLTA